MRARNGWSGWLIVGLCLVVGVACDEVTAPEDAGDSGAVEGLDSSTPGEDGGPDDRCTTDAECTDGLFCTGIETCDPSSPDADADGCVAATTPCTGDEDCREDLAECLPAGCSDPDGDDDGHRSIECGGDDCDDADPLRFPGAIEVCDGEGRDEDCNAETFGFLDADGDGAASAACCNGINCGEDCNDADSTVNPRAGDGPPLLCDGVDNDCSGTADEGCPCTEGQTQACGTPAQLAEMGLCRPGTQVCSGGMFTADCIGGVQPQEEVCDEQDNDCDGGVDDGVLRTYYTDGDGDGFGATGGTTVEACSPPNGFAVNDTDCDDTTTGINPLATETCNSVNDDCDAETDEGVMQIFYEDTDGDSFGNPAVTMEACIRPPGFVTNANDCNDGAQNANPAAPEACDGIDNNCDTTADEGCSCIDGSTRDCGTDDGAGGFVDEGECTIGTQRCAGGVWGACTGAVAPRPEICNTLDDNCDGAADEGVQNTYFEDGDGDGFGELTVTMDACAPPPGFVGNSGDCNDGAASISPAATETCDGLDNNCDNVTDPGCMCTDGSQRACGGSDGMGAEVGECVAGSQTCSGGVWTGCAGSVTPRAESCNQLDDNCNGSTDEGLTVDCYADPDDDGYSSPGAATQTFCPVAGRAEVMGCPIFWTFRPPGNDDCADDDPNRFPGQTEFCNDIDDDCDGITDEGTNAGCAVPNAYGACLSGACAIVGCEPGRGDCDGDRTNGCEVDTSSDSEHCSACGASCGGSACAGGQCELPSDIGGGGGHACVTFPSGRAACWGLNGFQQLGDGTTITRPLPAAVLDVDDAIGIDGGQGGSHTCVVTSTGTVECWGFGNPGQLGNGSNQSSMATPVIGISTATQVSMGGSHTCARLSDGTVRCWGRGNDGRLGNNSTANQTTPVTVSGLGGVNNVSAGGSHTCARSGGTIRCWGLNSNGQLGDTTTTSRSTPVLVPSISNASGDISAAATHTCAIRGSGSVSCWGQGSFGQLGNGGNGSSSVPVNVVGITDAVALASGFGRTCALHASGAVSCWGFNQNGALGNTSIAVGASSNVPVAVRNSDGSALSGVVALAAMQYANCVLRDDNYAYCWGSNSTGQLGDGTLSDRRSPTRVQNFGSVVEIDAQGDSTCARRGTGELLCWGRNNDGQLGDNTVAGRGTPTHVSGPQDFIAISAAPLGFGDGNGHSCGLRSGGSVACWGDNQWGQIGDGSNVDRRTPTTVSNLTDAFAISTGGLNSCAIRVGGQVQCWGFGDGTGRGVSAASNIPINAVGVTDAVSVGVGGRPFGCALIRDGTVECWGRNSSGQLGDGTTDGHNIAAPVVNLNDATQITVGGEHVCALRADRTVVCWGSNSSGQLGTGNASAHVTPTQVVGLDQVIDVVAGTNHTCARRITGELFCWGANDSSQLGDGTTANRPAPIAADGLGFVDEVRLGGSHTCVRELSGAVRCVGDNTHEQIFEDAMMTPFQTSYQTILGL